MSVHKVEIIEIGKIVQHPNADNLELTNVLGWQCCIGKGQFHTGDRAIYVEPDYLVPTNRPEFAFLAKRNKMSGEVEGSQARITVRRFRGTLSQGLIISVPQEFANLPVGTDVMEALGIERYEPPLPKSTYGHYVSAPSGLYVPKFDVESYQRYKSLFTPGETVFITEKIHGCLHANTKVMLVNGEERPICQIQVGDIVLSYDEIKKTMRGSTVKKIISRPQACKWIKLQFGERQIICTTDHCFMTNRGWVEAENLTFDDEILSFAP